MCSIFDIHNITEDYLNSNTQFITYENVNDTNGKGQTMLMIACLRYDNINAVNILLYFGANVDLQDDRGMTCLMYACRCGNDEIVRMLLNDANINLQDNDGYTALMHVCTAQNIKIIKLLLDNGANVNLKNRYRQIALQSVISNELIKLLLDYGSEIKYDFATSTQLKILFKYYSLNMLLEFMVNSRDYRKECMEEIKIRCETERKMERIKTKNFCNVLKYIPEHNAIIRYKIGNMGHKITSYDFDKIIRDDILWYLDADYTTIQQKAEQYLYDH